MHVPLFLAPLLALAAASPAPIDPDRLAGFKARSIGPAGMSGRVTSIAASVADPDLVYAGAATGGLWKSTNGGLSWNPIFDDQPVHAIGSVALDPKDPNVVWVGTGEGNTRNSASVGNGVYRSLDGGKTWAHLGLEKTERIYRLLLDPTRSGVAFACATGREWGEHPERGVFKTEDAGKTWDLILFADERTGCGELVMDPRNPAKLFAGLWQFRRWPWFFNSGGPGSGMYVTHDGGASWRKLQEEDGLPKGDLGRMGIAIAPSDPDRVYALVEAKASALVRSDDGGRTWKKVDERPNANPRPFYFSDLRVDPQWPNRLYSLDYNIRVSEDAGKTWSVLPGATWALIHGDHHALWIDPNDPTRMYAGNDGGVAESRDRGKSFRFVSNLPLAQFYHVAVDDERPYNVYGGLQDNGSWRGPSSVWKQGGIRNYDWKDVGGGDGFETLPVPGDASAGYSLWQGGNLMRWSLRTGEHRIVKPAPPEGVRLRFNWNAGLATDPFDPNVVYLGSQFLHRSGDRGDTWRTLSPDLTTNKPEWQKQDESGGLTPDVTAAENFTTIIAIAPSPAEKGVIWVGTDDGRIQLTRDGGASWASVETNVKGVPDNTWVPHIEASSHAAGTAFAVFDNHRRSDWTPYAFRTDDFGKTWKSLGSSELRGYALVLRQDPVKKELLFLGTEFGLFVSFDAGERWTPLKKTLPTASVMDLKIHPREHDLVIGTHGRAVWILDDIRPLREMSGAALQEPLRFFEVADAQAYWSASEEGGFGFGGGEYRGTNREYGAILTYSLNLPGLPLHDEEKERQRKEKERAEKRKQASPEPSKESAAAKDDEEPKVEITVTDAAGKSVRRFKSPARLGVNRVAWNLNRDAGKQPPRAEDAPPLEQEPEGPEVAPGSYTITLKFKEHEAKRSVRVLPDPRVKATASDWGRREEAVARSRGLGDRLISEIWRVKRLRDDIAVVDAKARSAAQDAGEKDKEKLDELPLVKAGKQLGEALDPLEKRLWQSPKTKGIVADEDLHWKWGFADALQQSSPEPPSPTQLEHLAQVEKLFAALKGEIDAFFDKDVARYRKQGEEARIDWLGR